MRCVGRRKESREGHPSLDVDDASALSSSHANSLRSTAQQHSSLVMVMAMGAMRTIPHAAVRAIRQLGPSSRASTSKWTIESDIALEVEEKRRQEAQAHSHVHAGGGPRRRHWSHHRAAAGSSSPARSMSMSMPTTMSMHTSARRAFPSNDRGVPEDRLVQYAESPPAYGEEAPRRTVEALIYSGETRS